MSYATKSATQKCSLNSYSNALEAWSDQQTEVFKELLKKIKRWGIKKRYGILMTEKLSTVKKHPTGCYLEDVQEIYSLASHTAEKIQSEQSRETH